MLTIVTATAMPAIAPLDSPWDTTCGADVAAGLDVDVGVDCCVADVLSGLEVLDTMVVVALAGIVVVV